MKGAILSASVSRGLSALLAIWLCYAPAARGQESTGAESAATADTLTELSAAERTHLIARLSDAQVRELLLVYLGRTGGDPSAAKNPDALLGEVEQKSALVRQN